MIDFVYPWIFLLVPAPLLVRWLVPPRLRAQPAIRVPFLTRLQSASDEGVTEKGRNLIAPLLVKLAVWLLLLTALARPQRLEPPIVKSIPARDLMLLVDLSASMDHQDFTDDQGKMVDRLTAVKDVLGDFLTQREGDRVGLIVFGTAPFLQVPFTTDLNLCQQLLDETEVGMAGPRTALGDAIGLAIRMFENSDVPTKTVIALTDGNDTGSAVPPPEAARVAKDRGITIHTVAIGDPTTVGEEKLDQESLQTVAKETGGDYFLALNRDELANIYDRLDKIETRDVQTVQHRPRRDLYFWFVLAAVLISMAAQVVRLVAENRTVTPKRTKTRVRVNSRTFELETVDS